MCDCQGRLRGICDDQRIVAALVDDETCILASRPDRVAWVVDQLLLVAAIVVSAAVAVAAGSTALAIAAGLAVCGLGVYFVGAFWSMCVTRYVLTSRRVMRLSGVLRDDREYMTWSKVTDVSVERSLADRATATATIRIHSANETSSFKALSDVLCPVDFADAIARQVNERQRSWT